MSVSCRAECLVHPASLLSWLHVWYASVSPLILLSPSSDMNLDDFPRIFGGAFLFLFLSYFRVKFGTVDLLHHPPAVIPSFFVFNNEILSAISKQLNDLQIIVRNTQYMLLLVYRTM